MWICQWWLHHDLLRHRHWPLGMCHIYGFMHWTSNKPLFHQYSYFCNEGKCLFGIICTIASYVIQGYHTIDMLKFQWFPNKKGLMGSIVGAGSGFGSIIWIPLQTAYVNPDNVAAVEVDGEDDR